MTAAALHIEDLQLPGTVVTVGDIDPVQCPCGELGALTTVRVYGDPAQNIDVYEPVDPGGAECCREYCALEVIGRALSEQDTRSRHPIKIEVTL